MSIHPSILAALIGACITLVLALVAGVWKAAWHLRGVQAQWERCNVLLESFDTTQALQAKQINELFIKVDDCVTREECERIHKLLGLEPENGD